MKEKENIRINLWNKYREYVYSVVLPNDNGEVKDISYWCNKIFFNLMIYITPLSIIALIPGVYMSFLKNVPAVAITDLTAFSLLLVIMFKRGLPLRIRKLIFIYIFFFLSVVLIYYIGKAGPGLLFLLTITVLSSIVYSPKAGYYSAWANTFICIAFTILNYLGANVPIVTDYSIGTWIAVSSNLVLLSFACARCLHLLISGLTTSLNANKTSEQELYNLINNTEESFILLGMDLRIVSFNKQFQYLYKKYLHLDVKKGEHILDYTLPERREAVSNVYKKVLAGNIEGSEIDIPLKNGDKKSFFIKYAPAKDESNNIIGAFVTVSDITEKKKLEVQKEFERRDKEALINSTDDLIWSLSSDFKLIAANFSFIKSLQESTGYTLKSGDDLMLQDAFSPEFLLYWQTMYNRALAGESFKIEIYTPPSSGIKETWRETAFNPIFYQDKIVAIACYARNITERKLAEAEREKMIVNIMQHSKNLEQFASIVSHNLRAPIANILGLSLVLKNELSEEDRLRTQGFLFTASEQLDNVIKDLNKILQVRSGLNEYKEPVNFQELVDVIKSSIHNLIEKEQMQIETDFTGIQEITSIKSYIYSIFYNFISNSIKYRRVGEPPVIKITGTTDKEKIRISFKDNGVGIDLTKHSEKIFGLYKRFHLNIEGKGLGLFMVKTQVETLGGQVTVKSTLGEGTEFIVELPL